MTVSSPQGAAIAQELGVTRVVLPRELSMTEITGFANGTQLELECFVHGALCVSWSGQCLTSEACGRVGQPRPVRAELPLALRAPGRWSGERARDDAS